MADPLSSLQADIPGEFMFIQVPRLLDRYALSYCKDGTCMEYFLNARKTHTDISQNLIISHDRVAGGIYVSKFYPQLFLERQSKYLSAACFYLMIHHACGIFGLRDLCPVSLETDQAVYDKFYARLREFEFRIARHRVGDKVCVSGCFHRLSIRTPGIDNKPDLFM